MPYPHKGESQSDYISRCMADSGMRTEFPDQKQRAAVCHAYWDKRKHEATAPGGDNTFIPAVGKGKPPRKYGMEDFVIVQDVPIFDEHGEWTPDKLTQIIDNCNARIKDTGDACPIIIGHTRDEAVETSQPDIVGWATQFRLGKIGKVKPRAAILATFKIKRDKWELAKKYPRRSVELWKEGMFIDPIALLGATTPARDLSLLAAQQQGTILRYEMKKQTCLSKYRMDNMQDFLKQVFEYLENSDVFKWARTQMQAQTKEAEREEEAEQDVTSLSDPSTGQEPASGPPSTPETYEKVCSQRDQARRRLARMEAEHVAITERLEAMERKSRVAERRADLLALEQEGICFEMDEEIALIEGLPADKYGKHLDHMRKRYQRAPIGVNLRPATVPVEGGKAPLSRDEVASLGSKAADLVASGTAKNVTEALAMLRN